MTPAPPTQLRRLRKSRTVRIAAVVVGLVVAAGAIYATRYEPGTAPATSAAPVAQVTTPEALPPVDVARVVCFLFERVRYEQTTDPMSMWTLSTLAVEADDTAMWQAGARLVELLADGTPAAGEPWEATVRAAQALAGACTARYGEGPW